MILLAVAMTGRRMEQGKKENWVCKERMCGRLENHAAGAERVDCPSAKITFIFQS